MNDSYLEYLNYERNQQLVADVLKENLRQQEGDYFIEMENDLTSSLMLLRSALPVIEFMSTANSPSMRKWKNQWVNSTRKMLHKYRNDYTEQLGNKL